MFEFLGMIAGQYGFRNEVKKYCSPMMGKVAPDRHGCISLYVATYTEGGTIKSYVPISVVALIHHTVD